MRQCKFCDDSVSEAEYAGHTRSHKKEEHAVCLASGVVLGKDSLYSHAIYLCKVEDARISDRARFMMRNEMLRLKKKSGIKVVQGGLPSLGKNR